MTSELVTTHLFMIDFCEHPEYNTDIY